MNFTGKGSLFCCRKHGLLSKFGLITSEVFLELVIPFMAESFDCETCLVSSGTDDIPVVILMTLNMSLLDSHIMLTMFVFERAGPVESPESL